MARSIESGMAMVAALRQDPVRKNCGTGAAYAALPSGCDNT